MEGYNRWNVVKKRTYEYFWLKDTNPASENNENLTVKSLDTYV